MYTRTKRDDYIDKLIQQARRALEQLLRRPAEETKQELEAAVNEILTDHHLEIKQLLAAGGSDFEKTIRESSLPPETLELIGDILAAQASLPENNRQQQQQYLQQAWFIYDHIFTVLMPKTISFDLLQKRSQLKNRLEA